MGDLEKKIIIAALGLVGILLSIVVFGGIKGADDLRGRTETDIVKDIPLVITSEDTIDELVKTTRKKDFSSENSDKGLESVALDSSVADSNLSTSDDAEFTPVLEAPKEYKYTVKGGDTLSEIAEEELGSGSKRYQDMILRMNPGLIANNLRIGQELILPTQHLLMKEIVVVADSANEHVIVRGDSLEKLAVKYYPDAPLKETVRNIVNANTKLLGEKGEFTTLRIGWKLMLPE